MAGESGFRVATAYVVVEPDTSGFPEKLKADLEKYDYKLKIPVDPDMDGFQEKVQAEVDALRGDDVQIPVDPDADGFREKVAAATALEPPVEVKVEPDVNLAGFAAKLDGARIAAYFMDTFGKALESSKIGLASSAMLTKINAGLADSFGLVQTRAAAAAMSEKALADVNESLANSTFQVGVAEKIAADLTDSAASHQDLLNTSRLAGVDATMALARAAPVLADANAGVDGTLAGVAKATDDAGAAAFRLYGRWGILSALMRSSVPLFGGMAPGFLAAVSGMHLLVDGIAEFAAVLIPATIAAVAFGAAAAPTIGDIVTHMQNLLTVTTATGKSIPPLTGGFAAVAAAVKPEVYQIFGDGLTVINHKMGEFGTLAVGAGHAFETLAARAAVALQSGGMSQFLKNAVQDLQKLGTVAGNVFGIFGNLLKTMPGYANVLLNGLVGVTHAIETVTGSGAVQRVIGAGLAFHGAFLYAGLGATLLAKAVSGGLGFLSTWAGKAAVAANGSELLGGAGNKAAVALGGLSDAAAGAAALPWAWIAVAAAGIGILAYKVMSAKDATQQWVASLQATVMAAPVIRGITALQGAQTQVTQRLTSAQQQLTRVQAGSTQIAGNVTGAYMAQVAKVGELQSAQKQLSDETSLYDFRLGRLAVSVGGTTKAMGLLVASGITMKQMLDPGALAQITQQVLATEQAYQAMGQRAGVLGADLNAMTIASSDQVTAMSKLNTAWDTTIGIVSAGQPAFITFQQSLRALTPLAKAAGASMGGLNAPSLALRAAWQTSYANGAKLIDALRMMSSASPGGFPSITRAVKDTVAQMEPLGKTSAATRAEMVSLAQEVAPGVKNFQDLTKWLGNTHNAARDLNDILAKSGVNIQDLTADAAKMADTMQNAVTSKFTLAKMAADGTNTAISKLATDMGHGASASKVAGDAMTLFTKLTRDGGYSAQAAAALVSTLTGTIFKVPKGWTTKFKADTGGALASVHSLAAAMAQIKSKTVQIEVDVAQNGGISIPGGGGRRITANAMGGVIPGYAPGRDSVPSMLSPGEGVLVPEAVKALGPGFVHAANAKFGGARVTRGNKTGHYAGGGITASAHFGFPQDVFNINVSDAFSSYGALGGDMKSGASTARMAAAGKSLADAFAGGTLTTAAAIKSETERALTDLKKYFAGPAASRLEQAIRNQSSAMEKLATASAKVSATISAMKSFAKNETSSLSSFSALSNITGTANATTGATAPPTGAQIAAGLGKDLGQLHKFFAVIKQLQKAKLSKNLIEQVIAMGPPSGTQYGEAILSGGAALIKELNKDERYINDDETKIGQAAADVQYGQKIGGGIGKGFLSSLKAKRSQLDHEMDRLGDEIAKELAKALGVPVKDITGLSGSGGGSGHHHAAHHKPAPNRDHKAHKPEPHKKENVNITVNLNGSKGKLSHEEVAGVAHEIGKQLALA